MSKLQGISPRIPLVYDKTDGPYQLNKTLRDTIRQNLKMLILTAPGERIMIPQFGVGIHRYLFEGMNSETFSTIVTEIKSQTDLYIPSVTLQEIDFFTSEDDPNIKLNEVRVSIKYNILPFNEQDQLLITPTMTN